MFYLLPAFRPHGSVAKMVGIPNFRPDLVGCTTLIPIKLVRLLKLALMLALMQMILQTKLRGLKMVSDPLPKKSGPRLVGSPRVYPSRFRVASVLSSARLPPARAPKRLQNVATMLVAAYRLKRRRKSRTRLTVVDGLATEKLTVGLNLNSRRLIRQKTWLPSGRPSVS